MKTMPQDRFTKVIRPLFLYVMREYKDAYDDLTTQSPSYPAILQNPAYMTGDALLEYDNCWWVFCWPAFAGGWTTYAPPFFPTVIKQIHVIGALGTRRYLS
jgi:hypothetical protein